MTLNLMHDTSVKSDTCVIIDHKDKVSIVCIQVDGLCERNLILNVKKMGKKHKRIFVRSKVAVVIRLKALS